MTPGVKSLRSLPSPFRCDSLRSLPRSLNPIFISKQCNIDRSTRRAAGSSPKECVLGDARDSMARMTMGGKDQLRGVPEFANVSSEAVQGGYHRGDCSIHECYKDLTEQGLSNL